MIFNLHNPAWINRIQGQLHGYRSIRLRLKKVISQKPEITVCIIAHNEEQNILRCLDSLSRTDCKVPFDIIVINNNSADGTQEILDRIGVTSYFEPVQGCGMARETGQQKATGKYMLLADADCVYPSKWVETMYRNLRKKGVVAVYGRHSFLGDKEVPRWKFALYDLGKDLVLELRNIRRPYLNAYGMSFGYIRELGLKEGFVTRNIRGEDGRLCFDLMKYGKIKLVRDNKSRVWTRARNFSTDGGLLAAVIKRIYLELARLNQYFKAPVPHNTKTSENVELTTKEYKQMVKAKFRKIFKLV